MDSIQEIRSEALKLCDVYSQGISDNLVEEILQLKEHLVVEGKKHVNISNMCNWIRDKNLLDMFSNIYNFKNLQIDGSKQFFFGTFVLMLETNENLRRKYVRSRLNDLEVFINLI